MSHYCTLRSISLHNPYFYWKQKIWTTLKLHISATWHMHNKTVITGGWRQMHFSIIPQFPSVHSCLLLPMRKCGSKANVSRILELKQKSGLLCIIASFPYAILLSRSSTLYFNWKVFLANFFMLLFSVYFFFYIFVLLFYLCSLYLGYRICTVLLVMEMYNSSLITLVSDGTLHLLWTQNLKNIISFLVGLFIPIIIICIIFIPPVHSICHLLSLYLGPWISFYCSCFFNPSHLL